MLTSDFDYNLPQSLIAQTPLTPRDSSRLMVVDRKNKTVASRNFFDIIDYLRHGDLLVWNNSKVFKARLFDESGKIEIFLLKPTENGYVWQALAKPGRKIKAGMRIRFANNFECEVALKEPEGIILAQFSDKADVIRQKANKYGHIPVPPYVKNEPEQLKSYQTIYAKHEGSVAAPTAGFHFTSELIEKLKNKGVEFAEVCLHAGLGTFLPVKYECVEDHTMHSEWVELSGENVEKINRAKAKGRRVIAVGTTTVRTLEGIALFSLPFKGRAGWGLSAAKPPPRLPLIEGGKLNPYHGDINLFITPGFQFQVVDALITNFHLPKSTLLMLVCAFAGDTKFMLQCYQEAVKEKYRFYSFGDAMLIF